MPKVQPITTAEVVQRLGVTRKVVRRLVEHGDLVPAQKLPGKTGAYLFDPADVDALTAERAS